MPARRNRVRRRTRLACGLASGRSQNRKQQQRGRPIGGRLEHGITLLRVLNLAKRSAHIRHPASVESAFHARGTAAENASPPIIRCGGAGRLTKLPRDAQGEPFGNARRGSAWSGSNREPAEKHAAAECRACLRFCARAALWRSGRLIAENNHGSNRNGGCRKLLLRVAIRERRSGFWLRSFAALAVQPARAGEPMLPIGAHATRVCARSLPPRTTGSLLANVCCGAAAPYFIACVLCGAAAPCFIACFAARFGASTATR